MKDLKTVKEYLQKQNELCLEQTGCECSIEDIECHLQSDEFIKMFGNISLLEIVLN